LTIRARSRGAVYDGETDRCPIGRIDAQALSGRPDLVKVLIALLPPPIKAHVPENYIAALT
jgi:hypothetical protein